MNTVRTILGEISMPDDVLAELALINADHHESTPNAWSQERELDTTETSYVVTNFLLKGYIFETKKDLDHALHVTLEQIFRGKTNMVWGYTKADIFKIYYEKRNHLAENNAYEA